MTNDGVRIAIPTADEEWRSQPEFIPAFAGINSGWDPVFSFREA